MLFAIILKKGIYSELHLEMEPVLFISKENEGSNRIKLKVMMHAMNQSEIHNLIDV